MSECIEHQDFDSEIFGRPFYRIKIADASRLERELAALDSLPRLVVDAKLPSEDVEAAAFLMRRGFRKICTQIELWHDLAGPTRAPEGAAIHSRANLPAAAIDAHARNFRTDRFALDVMLSQSDHDRLFARWIRNSLEGGRHSVSLRDLSFVTFREDGSDAKIDLVSVLNKGRGVGTDLMYAVLCEARARRKTCVKVVTECENPPAIGLYLKVGFRPVAYFSCFHLVRD